MTDKPIHARLSASKVPQYMNCPASPALSERVPDKHTDVDEYNVLGTAAHALAQICLEEEIEPSSMIGKKVHEHPETGDPITVDDEMAEAVTVYTAWVSTWAGFPECHKFWIEERLEWSESDDVSGIVDFSAVVRDRLIVADFKYGVGVAVSAEENEQLLTYALLALERLAKEGIKVKTVQLVVIQPRHHSVSDYDDAVDRWDCTPERVLQHANHLRAAINAVGEMDLVELTDGISADDPTPGDHCRFCRARAICPGVYKLNVVAMFGDQTPKIDFAAPDTITPEHLEYVLTIEPQIKAWLKAAGTYVFKELQRGSTDFPNRKLVERQGNRAYINKYNATEKLSKKYGKGKVTETRLLPLTKLEASLGKDAIPFIQKLVHRPITGITMVTASDSRPAIGERPPEDDFGPIVDGKVIEPDNIDDLF